MNQQEAIGRRRPAAPDLASEESGATAVEYALIAGFLSIMIAAACLAIGSELSSIFTNVATSV